MASNDRVAIMVGSASIDFMLSNVGKVRTVSHASNVSRVSKVCMVPNGE